jgi:hypothetical protein
MIPTAVFVTLARHYGQIANPDARHTCQFHGKDWSYGYQIATIKSTLYLQRFRSYFTPFESDHAQT